MSRRLRVVHLIDSLNPGGAERFTMHIVARLDGERFDRTLVPTRATQDWWPGDTRAEAMRELNQGGVRIVELGRSERFDLRAWGPLLTLLREEKTDVLHAHMFGSSLWGAIIGRLARVPVVIAHEHGSPPDLPKVRRDLDRYVIGRSVDAYLAVSEIERRQLVDDRGIPSHKTRVLPNGIEAPTVDASRDVRAELGIAPDAPVLGAVGVLRPEKAHAVLLRAAARLLPTTPGLRVVIVGDGEERETLEPLAEELGLGDAVLFTGIRTDVPEILRAFDVAVNASHREGSPLSVMEYMEAGLPVVATAVGGVPEIIQDGVHGRLVEPGDDEALAAAIADVLADREAAAEMGRRGRERRREHFDLGAVARRLEALYEELTAAAAARRR